MATQKDVKNRIASVKNIHKITRAMEMVAAAACGVPSSGSTTCGPMRRRSARWRVRSPRRPRARPESRCSRSASRCARSGSCWSPATAGSRARSTRTSSAPASSCARASQGDGIDSTFYVVGRRGNSTVRFRGEPVEKSYIGFTDRPGFANAREIAGDFTTAYVDGELDRVDPIYNRYVSPLTQYVRRQTLLPLQQAAVFGEGVPDEVRAEQEEEPAEDETRALWDYEPDPEELLPELFEEYVDLSVFRALLESTASEHGARMTAMRSAAENAQEMIDDLTLEMNRARQAEITQEILEVVAGRRGARLKAKTNG